MVTDSALDAPVGTWKCTWTRDEIAALLDLPFLDLVAQANAVHRENHPANEVQLSTLLSIKTGGCIEDCGYCSQSAHHETGLKATKLMEVQQVLQAAARAKDHGSTRFCMGAAWRNPKDKDTVVDTTLGTLVANLGYDKLVMPKPVFIGDTMRAESEVTDLRTSQSRPNAGIVTFTHQLINQRDEVVCQCLRNALLLRKPSA